MTYGEFDALVERTAVVLADLGITEGSTVGLISNNRWEWAAVASASHSLRAATVPMYEAQLPSDWTYILNDSGCSAVVVASQEIFDRVQRDVVPNVGSLQSVLCFDAAAGEEHAFATQMARVESGAISRGDRHGAAPLAHDLSSL